jgi:ribonuclease G
MVISVDVGEQRVAVIEDDSVVEVYLERRGRGSVAGSVYKGVVDNVLPGMEASFVDIGLERNGFLYVGEIVVPDGEQNGRKQNRRIQDLISRGQEVLVQAVKDPMGTKGARLTTEISLPGRFVVFVPYGDGIGISRRLDDEERDRLKKLCRQLDLPEGGIIVRTAAEGVTEEELRGDLALLRKLWATILGRSNRAEAPTLVYREAELPLRLVRDLFIRDFERMVVDHEPTHRRLVGYLKRTSPELAARVELDATAESILERHGVEEAMRSTLGRTVPLPSGGSLVFDYAEALTVVDVNTGRFVGAKGSQTSLEDTITKNNLEAAREVVRQLRLRDIGGIIVIDFIDMSNGKNRKAVEEELSRELARDRTKTYVVEISPLGLVEMTRQNVTDGPREILTVQCPTCTGEGVVISEETMVIDVERALRSRARSSDVEAMLVELNERTARKVIGPGGDRLADFETDVGKRVFVESRTDVPLDYMEILAEGTAAEMELRGLPVSPGDDIELELEDAYLLDPADAIGRLDGYVIVVGGAGRRVGETVRVAVDRVTRTTAYASVVLDDKDVPPSETLTAEAAIGVDGAAGELDDVELVETPKIERPSEEEAKETPTSPEESSDGEEAVEAKPASKRRRRRRKPAKKTDAEASEAKENADDGAQVTSVSEDESKAAEPAEAQNATEPSDGDAEGPKKPSRRRRRRGSRGRGSKGAGAANPGEGDSDSSSTGGEAASEAAPPVPPASETPGNGSPKPRRRRSTRSGTTTGGPTQNDAASVSKPSGTPQGDAPGSDESDGGTANDPKPANTETPDGLTDTTGSSEASSKPANRRRRRRSTSKKTASSKPVESASTGQPEVVVGSKPPTKG